MGQGGEWEKRVEASGAGSTAAIPRATRRMVPTISSAAASFGVNPSAPGAPVRGGAGGGGDDLEVGLGGQQDTELVARQPAVLDRHGSGGARWRTGCLP